MGETSRATPQTLIQQDFQIRPSQAVPYFIRTYSGPKLPAIMDMTQQSFERHSVWSKVTAL